MHDPTKTNCVLHGGLRRAEPWRLKNLCVADLIDILRRLDPYLPVVGGDLNVAGLVAGDLTEVAVEGPAGETFFALALQFSGESGKVLEESGFKNVG